VLDTPLDFLSTSILNGMEWLVELVPIFK